MRSLFFEMIRIFCENAISKDELAKNANISRTTISKWASSFPRKETFKDVKAALDYELSKRRYLDNLNNIIDEIRDLVENSEILVGIRKNAYVQANQALKADINKLFSTQRDSKKLLAQLFELSYIHRVYIDKKVILEEQINRTEMIFFDFDGTLSCRNINKNTWESLWLEVGFPKEACRDLHAKYSNNKITHDEWCELTLERFKEKKMSREIVERVASRIELIEGIEEMFSFLYQQNIKIFILSGSVKTIVQSKLGELCKYVEDISANIFTFDRDSKLSNIIGTNFDFEGKADYVIDSCNKYRVNPNNVLFVGNSLNDESVSRSGANTLCINPKFTNHTNKDVWHNYILECNNLCEIRNFIR